MSLPSASVEIISEVFPFIDLTTSPGLSALPSGMFSVQGMTPMMRRSGCSRPMMWKVPISRGICMIWSLVPLTPTNAATFVARLWRCERSRPMA
jgi:hypothetical protein